jgi:hypothetical protein
VGDLTAWTFGEGNNRAVLIHSAKVATINPTTIDSSALIALSTTARQQLAELMHNPPAGMTQQQAFNELIPGFADYVGGGGKLGRLRKALATADSAVG